MDFKPGVYDFAGGNSEEVRGLHLGYRHGHSKGGKAKVTGKFIWRVSKFWDDDITVHFASQLWLPDFVLPERNGSFR